MHLKGLIDEDVANYKKTSMFIATSFCSLKCDKENKNHTCQNSSLLQNPNIEIESEKIYQRYISNPLTSAIVIGGLEPFDTYEDLYDLLKCFRETHNITDDIVIYTGYREEEIKDLLGKLKPFYPLVVKFGRYRPNEESHYDEILGVELSNSEQHAKIMK